MSQKQSVTPGPRGRTSAELIVSGAVDGRRVYAAALVLAKLQDRGVGHKLGLEEMCEILGYLPTRRMNGAAGAADSSAAAA